MNKHYLVIVILIVVAVLMTALAYRMMLPSGNVMTSDNEPWVEEEVGKVYVAGGPEITGARLIDGRCDNEQCLYEQGERTERE